MTRLPEAGQRITALAFTLAALGVVFAGVARPLYRHWGTTGAERVMPLPGDEIVSHPRSTETRAITIRAPVERVWPWVAQLGQDRGGFYSYDLLENLVGCRMPTDDVLRPDRQQWTVGDRLWMYPPDRGGGAGYATLRTYIAGEALVFGGRAMGAPADAPEDGSWGFVVRPIDATTTRLLVRGRGAPGRSLLGRAFDRSVFEPAHFVMERRMLIGIRDLAERGSRDRIGNHLQIVSWTLVFAAFVAATVRVFRRPDWRRAVTGVGLAGLLFQLLTLVQPPALLSLALAAVLLAFVFRTEWRRPGAVRAARPAFAGV